MFLFFISPPEDSNVPPELLKKTSSRVEKVVDKPESKKRKRFKCPRCSAAYAIKGQLTQHLALHNRKGLFSCPTCGVRFNSVKAVKVHATMVHSQEENNKK